MIKNRIKKISTSLVMLMLFSTLTVNAKTIPVVNAKTTTTTSTAATSTVNIKSFGAHSIDEKGYSTFDSSIAINKAIQTAKNKGSKVVDFGSGKYYAKDISLESNLTYSSTQGAELIASPDIEVWHSVLNGTNKTNITVQGLTLNGNKKFVFGDGISAVFMISFSTSNNITVQNCYLHNSLSTGIMLQNNCNYVALKNNKIYDTDCGILSENETSNNIVIDGNTIYGSPENQNSEPISIYNSNVKGLAHDITITNNIVHDKSEGSGILVMNATKVLIKGNTSYNCYTGINIGNDSWMNGNDVTASNDVTITENNVYNCTVGIRGELNNSLISNNKISNIKGLGIQLVTPNGKSIITNNKIISNTITNINSLKAHEPAIRLENTANCVIDGNNVSDTRSIVLHWFIIEVSGTNAINNTVQNNTNLGATAENGYQIYLEDAKNTLVTNNIGNILDYSITATLTNNKTA